MIIHQDPIPGILLKKGESVDIVVSRGTHLVQVPTDLIGLTEVEATQALKAVGLKVAQGVPRNSNRPAGQVLDVNPPSGSQAPIGTGVVLIVSNGQVKVPDVTGMKVGDARAQLLQAGFQVTLDPSTSPDNSTVISQNPPGGSFVAYGSTVTLQTDAPSPTPTPSGSVTPSESPSVTPSQSPSPIQTF